MKECNPAADVILDQYFAVHDHGFVALVDYMGGDDAIDRAARTTVGKNLDTRTPAERSNLIGRLMRDRHTSPFEMVELKFHCAMPIFVARQWIRHRTANVNEYSGRYSKMPCMFYTPEPQNICQQNKKNKQGRGEQVPPKLANLFNVRSEQYRTVSSIDYDWCLENDISRELARINLPLSTYTQWYWKIDLHNLLHFLKLRLAPDAQFEIRCYAQVMAAITRIVVPQAYEHWDNYVLNAVTISRNDVQVISKMMMYGDIRIHPDIEEMFSRQEIEVPSLDTFPLRDLDTIRAEWNR